MNIFTRKKFENELKLILMKAINDNWGYYSSAFSETFKVSGPVAAMKAGTSAPTDRINNLALSEMASSDECTAMYRRELENHSLCGYSNFQNQDLTFGKIYLFFVMAFTGHKGNQSNCMEIDRYFLDKQQEFFVSGRW